MEKIEFLKRLIKSNIINMIKNGDTASLKELRNNPDSLADILMSIGASKKIIETPAHRERLEKILKEIIDGLIEEIPRGRDDVGYSIEFEENKLKITFEGMFVQDKYRIEIADNSYTIVVEKLRGTSGYSDLKLHGAVDKGEIMLCKSSTNLVEHLESLQKISLDDNGFVKEVQTAIKKARNGEEKEVASEKLKRDALQVISDDEKVKPIKWNGSVSHLNRKDASVNEIYNNIRRTIRKYPHTQKYYEELFGMSFDEVLREDKVD